MFFVRKFFSLFFFVCYCSSITLSWSGFQQSASSFYVSIFFGLCLIEVGVFCVAWQVFSFIYLWTVYCMVLSSFFPLVVWLCCCALHVHFIFCTLSPILFVHWDDKHFTSCCSFQFWALCQSCWIWINLNLNPDFMFCAVLITTF